MIARARFSAVLFVCTALELFVCVPVCSYVTLLHRQLLDWRARFSIILAHEEARGKKDLSVLISSQFLAATV